MMMMIIMIYEKALANCILFHTPQRSEAYRGWGAYNKTEQRDCNI